MICSLSNLENTTLEEIKALEAKMGKSLLAFSCHDLSASALNTDELKEVQALENKLGLSLVAVDA